MVGMKSISGGYKEHTFASGCGFTISKDVVKLIIENQNNWGRGHELAYAVGDDVTLGILLYNLGINPYPAPRFDITDSTYIPSDFFHYRCKTDNREFDVNNMDKIFISKYNNL